MLVIVVAKLITKHCMYCRRQLAGLGTKAAQEQWGVEDFKEAHRDIHSFAKRVGRLPEQEDGDDVDYRGLLHRDGSVISAVTLQVKLKPSQYSSGPETWDFCRMCHMGCASRLSHAVPEAGISKAPHSISWPSPLTETLMLT